MPSGTWTATLVLMSVLAVVALVGGLRQAWRRREIDTAFAFILLTGWAVTASSAWGVFTGERHTVTDAVGDISVRLSGLSATLSRYTWPILIVLALAMVMRSASLRSRPAPAGVAALLLCGMGAVANAYNGLSWHSWGLVATALILLAATMARPSRGAALGAATYGVTLGLGGAVAALTRYQDALGPCRHDKCGPLGLLFYGVFGNENAFGLGLAMALPFAALAFAGRRRFILVAFLAGMVSLTGSRSSLVAAAVTLAVLLVSRVGSSDEPRGRYLPLAAFTTVGVGLVGLVLPFTISDPNALSLRGYVWMNALGRLPEALLMGFGADGWRALRSVGQITEASAYATHNLWVEAMFTSGLAGLALLGLLLFQILRTTPFWTAVLPLITILTAGILEVPWTLTDANWLVWVLPTLLMVRRDPLTTSGLEPASQESRSSSRQPLKRSQDQRTPLPL